MIDKFRLHAKGGEGGSGCSSFRRSRHDRRGRADGGFSFTVKTCYYNLIKSEFFLRV